MARFYLDHDFTHRVLGPLRRLGHTVVTSEELGMGDAWDDEQLFVAVQQRAILLSFNYTITGTSVCFMRRGAHGPIAGVLTGDIMA